MSRPKYCNNRADVPVGEHYAIVEFDSIYIEGDERSRTHPGHGYPAHTEPTVKYIVFANQSDWESAINERMTSKYSRKDFVPVIVRPARIETVHKVVI